MKKASKIDKIIDNRFKISAVLIILIGIIGFFTQEQSIKDWILTTDKFFCLWWNFKFFVLILANYELAMYLTNQNKNLSFVSSIILGFSGLVQWNLNNIDSLIIGELIVVSINRLFESKSKKYSFIIIVSSILYTFTFRPYAIAFGYVFIALIIWSIIKNKDNLKENLISIITLIASIICMIIAIVFFNNNNVEYIEVSGNGFSVLFTYLYNFLLPFYDIQNKELFANIIGIFPIPLIMSLCYLYKKENHVEFLLPITIVMVFEIVFCISGFPQILSNVSLFSQTNAFRVSQAVELASLYIVLYFLENIKDELFKIKHAMRMSIVIACLMMFIGFPTIFQAKRYLYIFVIEITLFSFLLLNYTDKRYQKVLLFFILLFTLIGGIPVAFI